MRINIIIHRLYYNIYYIIQQVGIRAATLQWPYDLLYEAKRVLLYSTRI